MEMTLSEKIVTKLELASSQKAAFAPKALAASIRQSHPNEVIYSDRASASDTVREELGAILRLLA